MTREEKEFKKELIVYLEEIINEVIREKIELENFEIFVENWEFTSQEKAEIFKSIKNIFKEYRKI